MFPEELISESPELSLVPEGTHVPGGSVDKPLLENVIDSLYQNETLEQSSYTIIVTDTTGSQVDLIKGVNRLYQAIQTISSMGNMHHRAYVFVNFEKADPEWELDENLEYFEDFFEAIYIERKDDVIQYYIDQEEFDHSVLTLEGEEQKERIIEEILEDIPFEHEKEISEISTERSDDIFKLGHVKEAINHYIRHLPVHLFSHDVPQEVLQNHATHYSFKEDLDPYQELDEDSLLYFYSLVCGGTSLEERLLSRLQPTFDSNNNIPFDFESSSQEARSILAKLEKNFYSLPIEHRSASSNKLLEELKKAVEIEFSYSQQYHWNEIISSELLSSNVNRFDRLADLIRFNSKPPFYSPSRVIGANFYNFLLELKDKHLESVQVTSQIIEALEQLQDTASSRDKLWKQAYLCLTENSQKIGDDFQALRNVVLYPNHNQIIHYLDKTELISQLKTSLVVDIGSLDRDTLLRHLNFTLNNASNNEKFDYQKDSLFDLEYYGDGLESLSDAEIIKHINRLQPFVDSQSLLSEEDLIKELKKSLTLNLENKIYDGLNNELLLQKVKSALRLEPILDFPILLSKEELNNSLRECITLDFLETETFMQSESTEMSDDLNIVLNAMTIQGINEYYMKDILATKLTNKVNHANNTLLNQLQGKLPDDIYQEILLRPEPDYDFLGPILFGLTNPVAAGTARTRDATNNAEINILIKKTNIFGEPMCSGSQISQTLRHERNHTLEDISYYESEGQQEVSSDLETNILGGNDDYAYQYLFAKSWPNMQTNGLSTTDRYSSNYHNPSTSVNEACTEKLANYTNPIAYEVERRAFEAVLNEIGVDESHFEKAYYSNRYLDDLNTILASKNLTYAEFTQKVHKKAQEYRETGLDDTT